MPQPERIMINRLFIIGLATYYPEPTLRFMVKFMQWQEKFLDLMRHTLEPHPIHALLDEVPVKNSPHNEPTYVALPLKQ